MLDDQAVQSLLQQPVTEVWFVRCTGIMPLALTSAPSVASLQAVKGRELRRVLISRCEGIKEEHARQMKATLASLAAVHGCVPVNLNVYT